MNRVFQALQYLIRTLVDAPQKITVERIETPKVDIFTINAPPDEMGRLVGRKGRTAEAIREVLGAIGATAGKEVILDVIEARPAPRPKRGRRRSRPHSQRRSTHNAR